MTEAFRGWKQHRTVILPSLVTIFLCALLLAASLTFLLGSQRVMEDRTSFYGIEAYLLNVPKEEERLQIEKRLWEAKPVREVLYISPDSALQEFKKSFSSEMLDLIEGNPLPASFRLQLDSRYQNPAALQNLLTELEGYGVFERVQAPGKWAQWIEEWRFDLVFWPILVSALLLITLVLIIGNSVRLTLFSRKLLVENMKYAGGSSGFIQFPFVLEGAMQGLLGSGLAVAIWGFILMTLVSHLPFLSLFSEGLWAVLVGIVILVTFLGAYASYQVVRSFLHRSW